MRIDEAVKVAKSISALPDEKVSSAIYEMTRSRNLSWTVRALNMLVLDHPEHKAVAVAALEKLGMWIASERSDHLSGAFTAVDSGRKQTAAKHGANPLETAIENNLDVVWAELVQKNAFLVSTRPHWVAARAKHLIRANLKRGLRAEEIKDRVVTDILALGG